MPRHVSRKHRSSWTIGGARRDRTADLLRARQALSQLSYGPFNLSFFQQPALHLPRAWSHTHLYAPGARVKCALSAGKNPALKNSVAGYLSLLLPSSIFVIFGSGRAKATPWRASAREVAASFELGQIGQKWWVWVDSNHRPHPYQGCALTN